MQTEVTPISKSVQRRLDATQGVLSVSVLKKSIHDLVDLYIKKHSASEDFASTLKAVCEQSGVMPAVLRRLVKARAGDKFDKARKEVEQLAMVFEEVGE